MSEYIINLNNNSIKKNVIRFTAAGLRGGPGPQGIPGNDGTDGTDGTDGVSFVWRGDWVTATAYSENEVVAYNGSTYIALLDHTSGTFATDLAANKWQLMAQKGADGLGSGDMLKATYDPANKNAQLAVDTEVVKKADTSTSGYSFVVDEDNMVSDSATKLPTQQSVKAYVDTSIAGVPAGYNDEMAQDAVGTILLDSSEIDFDYNDGTPSITATLKSASIDETKLDSSVTTSLGKADTALQSASIGSTVQGYDADTAAIAALTPSNDDIIQRKSGAWTNRTVAQYKTDLTLVKGDVGLGNVDNTSDATKATTEASATRTLSNKRKTPRVYATTSTSTLTPEIDTYDAFTLTAQAANLTIANHSSSTPTDFEKMQIRILDNATARTITFGTNYSNRAGIALPTTTTISKMMHMGFEWNNDKGKWILMALKQEA